MQKVGAPLLVYRVLADDHHPVEWTGLCGPHLQLPYHQPRVVKNTQSEKHSGHGSQKLNVLSAKATEESEKS